MGLARLLDGQNREKGEEGKGRACQYSGRTSAGLQLLFSVFKKKKRQALAVYVAHAGLKLMAIPLLWPPES